MADQKKEEIKQEISLLMSDLIASLIQETIDADQAVTTDYLQEIKDYAFDDPDSERPKLKTVSFEMTDGEGRRQQVTIPVLSLLPLPVLHISEATFDIDTQVNYVEKIVDKEELLNQLKYRGRFSSIDIKKKNLIEKLNKTEDGKFRLSRLTVNALKPLGETSSSDPTAGASQAPTADSSSNGNDPIQHTFNARIHVKLEQSVLPSGMRGLLHETDRSITTEYI